MDERERIPQEWLQSLDDYMNKVWSDLSPVEKWRALNSYFEKVDEAAEQVEE